MALWAVAAEGAGTECVKETLESWNLPSGARLACRMRRRLGLATTGPGLTLVTPTRRRP
jgi:hypothetical protein